jgi:hypothetical protein
MNTFKNILHNCKQAQQIGVECEHKPVGFRKWLQLKIHIFYCSYCKRFLKQSALISKALRRMHQEEGLLSNIAKEKMQSKIDTYLKQEGD